MQTFTGIEYIKIAAANHFGLDKLTWQERIEWFDKNESLIFSDVEAITLNADEPILFRKTLTAYLDALRHQPTGYLMGIDATASGLQILACLIGCHDTARAVNLIDTGKREDVYSKVADDMADLLGHTVPRAKIKAPVMTTFYGSKEQPKQLFGEGSSELKAFYEILEKDLGGAMEVMNDIQSCWRSDVTENQWTLPDGHVARVKVMVESSAKIEVDELDHATFTHKAYVNAPSDYGISLAANVTHSKLN